LGDVQEQILVAASSTVVVERCKPNRIALFLCSPDVQFGRLRYELKRSLLYSTLSNL
jgi:hypothetical protein